MDADCLDLIEGEGEVGLAAVFVKYWLFLLTAHIIYIKFRVQEVLQSMVYLLTNILCFFFLTNIKMELCRKVFFFEVLHIL